jgi:exodeoxyribonuclease VIII
MNNNLHGHMIMPNAEYHSVDGVSSSNLSLLAESPVHLANKNLFKYGESQTFAFGSLVHSLVLEPHKTADEFVVMPSFDGRTKDGKAAKESFEANAQGKLVIKADDYIIAEKMALNVLSIAGGLFRGGVAESSYFADDDGVLVKCRPDYYIEEHGLVIDVKTTADISEFGIRKSITNYHYNWSAAWYLRVLNLLGLPAKKFVFVFVEKTAPYMVKIRELKPETLDTAHYEIDVMLASYREYLATGNAKIIHEAATFNEKN